MRSASARESSFDPDADRTARARIRDAAITRFAADGVARTTIRSIAADAGVSPALVIHHFGSKGALRDACDTHVADVIRERKHAANAAGGDLDVLAAVREASSGPPLARYLARTLVDGSPHVVDLVDELARDAADYLEAGVESGLLRPSDYPRERATLLTIWSLGALVLHEHLERLLGVDITAPPDQVDDPEPYLGPLLEVLGHGLMTDVLADRLRTGLLDHSPSTSTSEAP